MARKPVILVAPLNWGLGHASRCVPIIQELLAQGAEVILGAEEHPLAFLQAEFPTLKHVSIPGYQITYPKNGNMGFHMLQRLPKIITGIRRENQFLKQIIHKFNIDGVISDNRYGLHSTQVPTVFITHQLTIKAPFGETAINRLNNSFLSKFNHIWVPDLKGSPNLSGTLSHNSDFLSNTTFIGPLSRFRTPQSDALKNIDVLAIISGPEPQRTQFENLLLAQFEDSPLTTALVLGKTINIEQKQKKNMAIYSHLPTEALFQLIHSSNMIISRSGYSTLMDLAYLQKPAVLVPTPGQTEQEYLAKYHLSQNHFYSVKQAKFDLNKALEESESFNGIHWFSRTDSLQKAVTSFLDNLS